MGVYLRGKSWYLDFYLEGKRYTECVGQVTKTIAKEKETVRKREVIQGQYKPKVEEVLFKDFKRQYIDYSRTNKKPNSSKRDESSLKRLSPFFDGKRLSDIDPLSIERYKRQRRGEDMAPATVNRELACLRHMFTMAIKWKKAMVNPVQEVKFLEEPEAKDRILSEGEEIRLLEAVRGSAKSRHLEPIIITALNTGMRKSEILNLQWSNVDFQNGYILVEHTKNGKIRKIPMNKKLTETLKSAKKHSKGEYVFSQNGQPYGDVKTGWGSALERAGIEGFTFHSMRHTFGSRLGMAGVDLGTLQELMGHMDPKMTKRYNHPSPEHKRKAVEILDRVTTVFTTQANPDENRKVVNIGNR